MLTFDVNWLAVLVAAVANMLVGAIWYGPLFSKRWMEENGFTMEQIESGQMAPRYMVAILNSVLMAFILANVIAWTGATGLMGGVMLGFLMWLGFNGFSFAANHAFEMRSTSLWFINTGVYLLGLLVIGAILGVWQ